MINSIQYTSFCVSDKDEICVSKGDRKKSKRWVPFSQTKKMGPTLVILMVK